MSEYTEIPWLLSSLEKFEKQQKFNIMSAKIEQIVKFYEGFARRTEKMKLYVC